MKIRFIPVVVLLMMSAALAQQPTPQPNPTASAQTPSTPPSAQNPVLEYRPDDVKSVDAILAAIYDVISGPAGPRDWKRFESLFIPEGRLIASGINAKGEWVKRVMTPEEYEKRAGDFFMKEGFFERGVSNKVETFGTIAHVFSTYESRHEKDGQPFARGINSIQLVSDGHRWYVVQIFWQQETPTMPIPKEYLPK